MKPTIALGSDHAGFEMKSSLKEWLASKEFEVKDFGVFTAEAADYPDIAHPVAEHVSADLPTPAAARRNRLEPFVRRVGLRAVALKFISRRAHRFIRPFFRIACWLTNRYPHWSYVKY